MSAAIVLRVVEHTNCDVSWLIDLGERTLDGAAFYKDFFEVNPPASVLIYLPAVALARWAGTTPEFVVAVLTFLAVGLSLGLAGLTLRRAGLLSRCEAGPMVCGALFGFLVLPAYAFAEREHIALLALLVALSTLAARTAGRRPEAWLAVMAAVGIGIAMSIKPIFALALLGPAIYLWMRRGWRPLLTAYELWVGAVLSGVYALWVVYFVPVYQDQVLPVVLAAYLPVKLPALSLFISPGLIVYLCFVMLACSLGSLKAFRPLGVVLILSSAGFESAFLIQGKGWPYHAYPALALGLLAYLTQLTQPQPTRPILRPRLERALFLSCLAAAMVFCQTRNGPDSRAPGLVEAIQAISSHPRMAALTDDLGLTYPMVRELRGVSTQSVPSTWISPNAKRLTDDPLGDPVLGPLVRAEQERFADDAATGHPDVILVDGDFWPSWIRSSARITRLFQEFDDIGTYGNVTLWSRKPPLRRAAGSGTQGRKAAGPTPMTVSAREALP